MRRCNVLHNEWQLNLSCLTEDNDVFEREDNSVVEKIILELVDFIENNESTMSSFKIDLNNTGKIMGTFVHYDFKRTLECLYASFALLRTAEYLREANDKVHVGLWGARNPSTSKDKCFINADICERLLNADDLDGVRSHIKFLKDYVRFLIKMDALNEDRPIRNLNWLGAEPSAPYTCLKVLQSPILEDGPLASSGYNAIREDLLNGDTRNMDFLFEIVKFNNIQTTVLSKSRSTRIDLTSLREDGWKKMVNDYHASTPMPVLAEDYNSGDYYLPQARTML